jgi:asparagine synthase (glutamine-hydrolysing)
LDAKILHLIDESEFQDEINKSNDINDVAFDGENESTLSKLDFYLEVIGQPFFFPNLYLPNKAFKLASDKGIALMMNGNDGDSVISHGYEYFLELFFSLRWVKLFQQINLTAKNNNQSRRFIFKRLIYDNLSLNNLYNSSSQKKHLEVMSSSNHSKAIEIQSLLASYYGIEERYPFYNKELIEYCLNTSPSLKNKHGHSRYILKEAIKNVVPEKIRNRTTKANLGHALCLSFLQKDYELINEQFSNPNPLIKNIINFNDLNKSWDDLKKSPRKYATRSSVPSKIFSFVVLNRWLDYKKQKYEKA